MSGISTNSLFPSSRTRMPATRGGRNLPSLRPVAEQHNSKLELRCVCQNCTSRCDKMQYAFSRVAQCRWLYSRSRLGTTSWIHGLGDLKPNARRQERQLLRDCAAVLRRCMLKVTKLPEFSLRVEQNKITIRWSIPSPSGMVCSLQQPSRMYSHRQRPGFQYQRRRRRSK